MEEAVHDKQKDHTIVKKFASASESQRFRNFWISLKKNDSLIASGRRVTSIQMRIFPRLRCGRELQADEVLGVNRCSAIAAKCFPPPSTIEQR